MGNADRKRHVEAEHPVHPHVHGERSRFPRNARRFGGSSPRTWGTQASAAEERDPDRFIPTYMGNAGFSGGVIRPPPVHPHVHGERVAFFLYLFFNDGSSPRTWGTRCDYGYEEEKARFIPTYMGNARYRKVSHFEYTVHPHVHGERFVFNSILFYFDGSSPRTWGTPLQLKIRIKGHRFIPTYMGNAKTSSVKR